MQGRKHSATAGPAPRHGSKVRPTTVVLVTSQPPTEPPESGPAVEVPPHGEKIRPTVTVFQHPRPSLWIFWPDRWQTADVRARHDWPTGAVAYQVEINIYNDEGSPSRVSRTFLWGPDSIRPA